MRIVLACLLLLLNSAVSLGQERYFGDQRYPGLTQASWNPDGTQFATWGPSPYVEIWRASDGLRLMVLDHAAPSQIVVYSNAHIADFFWSDDGETITTVIHTANLEGHVRQQRWSAATGELLYSIVVGRADAHMPRLDTHQIIRREELVASWTGNRVSYIDIELGSASLGQEVASIDFGDLGIHPYRAVHWRADSGQALFTLMERPDKRRSDCAVFHRLVDIDLSSASFGETLWELEVARGTLDNFWYSAGDLFARIDLRGYIDIWDLDRSSARFGEQLLRIEREFEFFHNLLFDTKNRRVIVVEQNNMEFIEGAHPDAGPVCIDKHCEFHIGFWDADAASPTFAERVADVTHVYPQDYGRGVLLNQSETQLHIYTTHNVVSGDESYWMDNTFAYDLVNGEPVSARDIVPEPVYGGNQQQGPQVDLSHLVDDSNRNLPVKFLPIALNHDGSMLLTRKFVGENVYDATASIVVIDMRTGEQHLPVE